MLTDYLTNITNNKQGIEIGGPFSNGILLFIKHFYEYG